VLQEEWDLILLTLVVLHRCRILRSEDLSIEIEIIIEIEIGIGIGSHRGRGDRVLVIKNIIGGKAVGENIIGGKVEEKIPVIGIMGVEMTADEAVDVKMMGQEGIGVARSVIIVELESLTVREISILVRPLKQSTMMEVEEVDHVAIETTGITLLSTAARSIDENIIDHKNESMRMIMSKSMMTWKHKKLSSLLRGISLNEARGVAIRS